MEQAAAATDLVALAQTAHLLKGATRELDQLQATADQTRQALGLLLSLP